MAVFFFMSVHTLSACDCDSQGEFLKVAPQTGFVALVKVIKYSSYKEIDERQVSMSMEVEVVDVYKGTESRKVITVWGDNGILCRPYLSQFDTGNYYVIAFSKGTEHLIGRSRTEEKSTDYSISICGEYWLKADIKKQVATGAVTEKETQIKLADLKAKPW